VRDVPVYAVFVSLGASSFVIAGLALEVADPAAVLLGRFVVATLITLPFVLRRTDWSRVPVARLAVVGLLFQVVQFGGLYIGISLGVPAALSALVLVGLSPVVTFSLSVLLGQERADWRVAVALAVGVAGVAISLAPELGSSDVGLGVLATVIGMLGLAVGTVLSKRWVAAADPYVTVSIHSSVALVAMVPVVVLTQPEVAFGVQFGLSVAVLAAGMGVFALWLLMFILGRHPASTASALLLLNPPGTALLAVPVLGQQLHAASVAGMLVAMAGVGAVVALEASSSGG
jgi:drug/metabolite transporter (DMT)-like permease